MRHCFIRHISSRHKAAITCLLTELETCFVFYVCHLGCWTLLFQTDGFQHEVIRLGPVLKPPRVPKFSRQTRYPLRYHEGKAYLIWGQVHPSEGTFSFVRGKVDRLKQRLTAIWDVTLKLFISTFKELDEDNNTSWSTWPNRRRKQELET